MPVKLSAAVLAQREVYIFCVHEYLRPVPLWQTPLSRLCFASWLFSFVTTVVSGMSALCQESQF